MKEDFEIHKLCDCNRYFLNDGYDKCPVCLPRPQKQLSEVEKIEAEIKRLEDCIHMEQFKDRGYNFDQVKEWRAQIDVLTKQQEEHQEVA